MNTLDAIKERRSVRGFKEDAQISDENLNEILSAAMYAPLAMNRVLWHFSAVQSREILGEIAEKTIALLRKDNSEHIKMRLAMPSFSPYYGAPTVIFVFGDKANIYSESNCGAAMQNMLLAAKELGIDSCWVDMTNGFLKSDGGRGILEKIGMPAGYDLVGCVALGYAKNPEIKMPNKHFDEYESIVNIIK